MKKIILLLLCLYSFFANSQTVIPLAGFKAQLDVSPIVVGDTIIADFNITDFSNQFNGLDLSDTMDLVVWKNCNRYEVVEITTAFASQVSLKLLKDGNPNMTIGSAALLEESESGISHLINGITESDKQCIDSYYRYLSVNTEAQVDSFIANNNPPYLTEFTEIDGDPNNELQSISLQSNQLILDKNGGSVSLNGYVNTDDQTMQLVGNTLYIEDGNFVDLSQFDDSEVDGDVTNELQVISIGNDTIYLTDGGFVVLPASVSSWNELSDIPSGFSDGIDNVIDNDNDSFNEIQDLSGIVDSIGVLYDTLSNYSTDLVDDVDDADNDPTNEIETWATLSGIPADIADGDDDTQLSESEVDAMVSDNGYLTSGDNLGNHEASENVHLNNNYLSNDGGNEGIKVAWNGIVTTSTSLKVGNDNPNGALTIGNTSGNHIGMSIGTPYFGYRQYGNASSGWARAISSYYSNNVKQTEFGAYGSGASLSYSYIATGTDTYTNPNVKFYNDKTTMFGSSATRTGVVNIGGRLNLDAGTYNHFIGHNSGLSQIGIYSQYFGHMAGGGTANSNYSQLYGFKTGYNNTGDYVYAFGRQAAYNNTGIDCLLLGHNVGFSNTIDDRLMIDNTSTDAPLLDGRFDTNKLTINGDLTVTDLTGGTATHGIGRDANKQLVDIPLPTTYTAGSNIGITNGVITNLAPTPFAYGSGNDIFYNPTDAEAGFGTSTPSTTLDVHGGINFTRKNGTSGIFNMDYGIGSQSSWFEPNFTHLAMRSDAGGTFKMKVDTFQVESVLMDSDGDVGDETKVLSFKADGTPDIVDAANTVAAKVRQTTLISETNTSTLYVQFNSTDINNINADYVTGTQSNTNEPRVNKDGWVSVLGSITIRNPTGTASGRVVLYKNDTTSLGNDTYFSSSQDITINSMTRVYLSANDHIHMRVFFDNPIDFDYERSELSVLK